jgi:hypothetical protein
MGAIKQVTKGASATSETLQARVKGNIEGMFFIIMISMILINLPN